jgi:hypothetical protein
MRLGGKSGTGTTFPSNPAGDAARPRFRYRDPLPRGHSPSKRAA